MKSTGISIVIAGVFIAGAVALTAFSGDVGMDAAMEEGGNVNELEGMQIISITAKGGYFPRATVAKADIPTTITVTTKGTFDCSSALAIPGIGYRANLPPSGVTDITIPPQKTGTKLVGVCAMGMYNFSVSFK